MIPTKKTIISGATTRQHEKGHFNPKTLLEKSYDIFGSAKAARLNGVPQSLAGLISECRKQFVETMLLQGFCKTHTPRLLKTPIKTVLTDA